MTPKDFYRQGVCDVIQQQYQSNEDNSNKKLYPVGILPEVQDCWYIVHLLLSLYLCAAILCQRPLYRFMLVSQWLSRASAESLAYCADSS